MQVLESGVQEPALPRRRFLGSAMAIGAGAAIGTTLSYPATNVSLAAGRRDLVHDELVRQLKDGVRALRGAQPGEAARRLASTARILAEHYTATGLDADIQRKASAAVRRDGREALLRREFDGATLAAEAKAFGIDIPVKPEPFDRQARERALSALLSKGVSPAMREAAEALERIAPHLDRRGVVAVSARQSGCPDLTAQLFFLEFVALTSCLWNPIACAGFQGAYWGLKLAIYLAGC
jgi:hypothetical protein